MLYMFLDIFLMYSIRVDVHFTSTNIALYNVM